MNNVWEEIYASGQHYSVWPWSELVSLIMRHAIPKFGKKFRVLELGCGAGANIPFFRYLEADYFGIDISPTIIENLRERFPELKGNLQV